MKKITRTMKVMTVTATIQNPLGGTAEVVVYMEPKGHDEIKKELKAMYGGACNPEITSTATEVKKVKVSFHDFVKASIA